MKTTEMPVAGQKRLVRFENLEVLCRVKEVGRSYGRVRLEVEPINGEGSQWVEITRLRPINGQK